jgi:hypothetical protein
LLLSGLCNGEQQAVVPSGDEDVNGAGWRVFLRLGGNHGCRFNRDCRLLGMDALRRGEERTGHRP